MSVHSFFEGIALGVTSGSETWNMVIAVVAHKWSEALTIGISFVQADLEITQGMWYIILYSLITPLGVVVGYILGSTGNPKIVGVAKALSAGTFLYISCGEIIVKEFAIAKDKRLKFLFYFLGIVFVAILGLLEE
jgi:zinc transporter ZupT